jgi:hypothetical protein
MTSCAKKRKAGVASSSLKNISCGYIKYYRPYLSKVKRHAQNDGQVPLFAGADDAFAVNIRGGREGQI